MNYTEILSLYCSFDESTSIMCDLPVSRRACALFSVHVLHVCVLQVVGVARFVRTSNSSPQLLALVPQAEELSSEDGSQLSPPGFHALVLPFADDLRDLPAEPATATTTTATTATEGAAETSSTVNQTVSEAPQLAAAAEALVGAVTLEREAVMSIHNPVLQKQYHMLQVIVVCHYQRKR